LLQQGRHPTAKNVALSKAHAHALRQRSFNSGLPLARSKCI
jgi:hypothetical protein